jgi:hypothetical protein
MDDATAHGYRIARFSNHRIEANVAAHEALAASVRRTIAKQCAQRARVGRMRAKATSSAKPPVLESVMLIESPPPPSTKPVRTNAEWARLYAQAMSVFKADVALRLQHVDFPAAVPMKPKKRVRFQLPDERPKGLPRGLDELIRGPSAYAPSH